jgi:flagellar basal-body rod protein FlgF
MDRLLYIAMTGAKHALQTQAANNHNLANLGTTGFKADLVAYRSAHLQGPGAASRAYGVLEGRGTDLSPGPIQATGNELDVAVDGSGWLAVQGSDGREAYTRAGDLRVSSAGLLVNGAGHLVLGDGGPIAIPPAEKIEIAGDGTLSIVAAGEPASNPVTLDRLKLVDPPPADLEKADNGLLYLPDGATAPPDAAVRVVPGALEGSNVSAVDALVNMISHAREFELQVKMMGVAEENDRAEAGLLRLA